MSDSGLLSSRSMMSIDLPGPSNLTSSPSLRNSSPDSPLTSTAGPSDILRMLAESQNMFSNGSPKTPLEHLLGSSARDQMDFQESFSHQLDVAAFGIPPELSQFGDFGGVAALRNSAKNLKCPKCNWNYKYQAALEVHMKEKHSEGEVKCLFCVENRAHPKLARGESYSCGYKPYRCELCKYSTTTKGNLSIHMQSDKHLHAMQELPNSMASLSCPASTTRSPGASDSSDRIFHCIVCGCFSTDHLHDVIQHADKDRSRASHMDVSVANGVFQCHLCPYSTNLKANFQLHTRTDKHLQRVQMVNHIREGNSPVSALCRLGTAKTPFQVLCRPCQEILPSSSSLREHCDSFSHRLHLQQPVTSYNCRICAYETQNKTEAKGHMTCHEPATWPKIDLDALMVMNDDCAYACASCGFTAKDVTTLEEHAKSHEEGDPCPLCEQKQTNLTEHLVAEHKIPESAVDKLMHVHRSVEPLGSSSSFAHRCSVCEMVFRTESALQSHSLLHLFSVQHKCPECNHNASSLDHLKVHMESEHPTVEAECRCELCQESFVSKSAYLAHLTSIRHLHKTKKQLELGSVDLNSQLFQSLANPGSPGERKPYKCNVCKSGFGQGATLDIHLRSVAHQTRLSKLSELIASGEVDPSRPYLEQPGGPPQKTIGEMIENESGVSQQQNVMTMFNIMNMLMGQNVPPTSAERESPVENEVTAPRTATHLLQMIKTFGIDRLMSASGQIASLIPLLGSLREEEVVAVSRVDCNECGETLPSLVLLSIHYQDYHTVPLPDSTVKSFIDRLASVLGPSGKMSPLRRSSSRDDSEPPEKRPRSEPTPPPQGLKPDLAQMAMMSMMSGLPFSMNPGSAQMMNPQNMQELFHQTMMAQQLQLGGQSPAKRARTRISDDQLKVLRQYFDINNSPTENQIKEMSIKANLPEKVIKHWFRNTLFKERQRDKDSPYNFNIPPQMSIDLDTYEKTGEAKVLSAPPEVKPKPVESKPSECSSSVSSVVSEEKKSPEPSSHGALSTLNLQAMMQQMQQAAAQNNPFQFMEQQMMQNALGAGSMPSLPSSHSGPPSGRRANRTRFTDYQLRTLQQFFDKQPYPKDDDLEVLSKKLQLSPRVIVVWFQNARQKVSSNGGRTNLWMARKIYENQPNTENNDRFVRTPGSNFQCKRCSLVYQRYYELIQHQQKTCYKDDTLAQANDNKCVEETLSEEEKSQLAQQVSLSAIAEATNTSTSDLLKLFGTQKSSTEALLRMCESANTPSPSGSVPFHKRCPFCALLFRNKQSMLEHLTLRHTQQMFTTSVDVDRLPDAEEVPVITTSNEGALDLTQYQDRESLSMSPFLGTSDNDDVIDSVGNGLDSESPFSAHLLVGAAGISQPGAAPSPANNKRYRTHLTPLQVHVMKHVFLDYKTPSMPECDVLGRDIGLHKRVVQVWFQNARAKERKNRASNGEGEDLYRSTSTGCSLCGVEYNGRVTIQDHIFSLSHLTLVKSQMKSDGSGMDLNMTVENRAPSPMTQPPVKKEKIATKPASNPLSAMNLSDFPFNLMAGMMTPAALPMMFNPTVFGVSVDELQIPSEVKEQIKTDMEANKQSNRFTHDGLSIDSLKQKLPSSDSNLLNSEDVEVGWGCPTCQMVFQAEVPLRAHQMQCCTGIGTFTLIQSYYNCIGCSRKFSSQIDFLSHCDSAEHQLHRK